MTEVKLDIRAEDVHALRMVLAASEKSRDNTRAWHRAKEILSDIEVQLAPAIEEPIEFASVVRAEDGLLVVRVGAAMHAPWVSGHDHWTWEDLKVSEVLRIGVGGTWRQGFDDCALHLRKQLIQLRSSAITAERQDAYDKAIAVVEGLS